MTTPDNQIPWPPATTYPKKKHTARNVVLIVIAALFATCGAVAFAGVVKGGSHHGTLTKASPTWVQPSTKPKTAVKNGAPAGIGEGTWVVGKDIKAGKYRTTGASDSSIPLCYWDIRTGSESGTIKTQGVKATATAQGLVTLKTGEYFTTSGCKTWTPAS